MLTGEKILVTYKKDPGPFCEESHYDFFPLRVSAITADLSRPEPKEKTGWITTGQVS